MSVVRVGTAGWSLSTRFAGEFSGEGTHLERYGRVFEAVEINTTFYRPHRPATFARWAESVPAEFRFAVKVPKAITHERRLTGAEGLLDGFLDQVGGLGDRLGPLLVQLPPSLGFAGEVAEGFFAGLRQRFGGLVACEPRHATWFTEEADALLTGFRVGRVAADPAPVAAAAVPGGWAGLVYHRLHGSPRMYYSAYGAEALELRAQELAAAGAGVAAWCIFDNTADGEAVGNALELRRRVAGMR